MEFLAYLAVMIVGSLIAVALAPKPPKQKAPTLADFDLPTAEEGRAIPWIFGTYRITDPNIIWYGDLEVRSKTKDGVKTRLYRMGLHLECCIGPVDALVALHYGGKDCEISAVTSSQRIRIEKPNLFGGRDKEGGIDGEFDVLFGGPTQGVNDYLASQIGTPLSAFRDSLTIVGRKPSLIANSTYVKPLHPTIRCASAGWDSGECWYPETVLVPDIAGESAGSGNYTEISSNVHYFDAGNATTSPDTSSETVTVSGLSPSDVIELTIVAGSWSRWLGYGSTPGYYPGSTSYPLWFSQVSVRNAEGSTTHAWSTSYMTQAEAQAGNSPTVVTLTGSTEYKIWLYDDYLSNRGAMMVRVRVLQFNGGDWDMNPAHIIYKAITSTDQGAGEPSATLDDASFRAAALTFHAEGCGLSFQWRNEGPIFDFLAEVCRHAGAVLTLDPRTGLTKLVPLRDDYTPAALDLITEDHITEVVEWQDAADGESINEVTVEYRKRDGSKGTATWVNRASVQEQGVSHQTIAFPGITQHALALRVAKRECMQRSSNLSRGKLKVNRNAWDKLPGEVFRFSHGPEGIDELVVRVIDIDLGTLTDGEITVAVMQDIFSLDDVLTDTGDPGGGWVAPDTAPAAATAQDVMEAPYWQLLGDLGAAEAAAQAPGAGYVVPLIGKPTGLSTEFNAWARISPGAYAEAMTGAVFAPTATLTAALDRSTDSGIALTGAVDLDLVEPGWIAVIGTSTGAELCYVGLVDTTLEEISILRARMDTTPQLHAAGTRVWFLDSSAQEWPRIPDEFSDADAVDVKAQTATDSGLLDITAATAASITLASRQVRPYPPGNIEINGEYHPAVIEGALTVTWAHRDRVVQGATLVSQYDATDYGPEAGTTYNAYAYDDSDDTLLDSDTAIAGATWSPTIAASCTARIEIESVRDGYVSWQRQVRTFGYIATASILTEASDYLLTEAGDYLITET